MKNTKLKTCLSLFGVFFKIGLFTFGGGYAMIPLIQREAAEKKRWIRVEDMLDIVAIAESTPGPIAVNAATFVGRQVGGFAGAACATCGVILPSLVIISLLSHAIDAFSHLRAVKYAFFGVRAGVLALILKALWSMYCQSPKQPMAYAIAAAALLLVALLKVNVMLVILLCAVTGLIYSLLIEGRRER